MSKNHLDTTQNSMENNRIIELKKQLEIEEAKEKKKRIFDLEEKTGLKVGTIVEVIDRERINDYDYKNYWTKTKVLGFNVIKDNIYVYLEYTYKQQFLLKEVKIFKENDYTLRHSLWDRELDIDDEFQLIVDKPKSTKGDIYEIFKVIKQKNYNIEYWYYNDNNQLQTLYEGEFHVIKEK